GRAPTQQESSSTPSRASTRKGSRSSRRRASRYAAGPSATTTSVASASSAQPAQPRTRVGAASRCSFASRYPPDVPATGTPWVRDADGPARRLHVRLIALEAPYVLGVGLLVLACVAL